MLSTLINRIYLNKLSVQLNRTDKRSVRNWCLKNNLKIYKDSSGEFVIENELELAYNMPLIKDLKLKHSDRWIEYYEAYNKGELYKLLDLKTTKEKTGYIPKGKLSSKLFGGSP
jgi:hypothetical protein